MAKDVHALAGLLGFKKVKIVGHDIGLMVAYAYAAQFPDSVERIVLMDAFLPGLPAALLTGQIPANQGQR
jgi:pimeloyl-ACP methyl ester carboxylesterase